jgi:branched-chain amino acid transport system substrate-binding protein
MRLTFWRPLSLMVSVFAIVALLALACEDEEEDEATPTPPVAETPTEAATPTEEATPGVTPTEAPLGPGAAGIPSNPRDVRGLEGVLVLDDGLAVFKERPADEDRTGVTEDSIKICESSALSGPIAALFVPGLKERDEFINRINEVSGGIHGREIELVRRDDQYNPAVAVDAWKQLVEGDECFAGYGMSGTPPLLANIDFFRQEGFPSIQAQTGATLFCEPTDPLTFCTSVPPYLTEGKAMGDYIMDEQPDATVAAIYDNNDFGLTLLEGVKAAVPEDQLVAEIAFEPGTPDPTPMMLEAVESGADFLAILTNAPVPQIVKGLRETAGSDMKVVVEFTSISLGALKDAAGSENFDGTVGFSIYKDSLGTDPAVTKYRAIREELEVPTGGIPAGFSIELLVRALELAGPDPTREGLIEAMQVGFDGSWTCSMCLDYASYQVGPRPGGVREVRRRGQLRDQ